MKKILAVFLTVISTLILSSCSDGISQDEYDALVSENLSLKKELESMANSFVVNQNFSLSSPNGDKAGTYTGTVNSNGIPDGFGKFIANDNTWSYYGDWSDGQYDGHGITQWSDSSHIGFYENGYIEGTGIFHFDDGSVYCAEFEKSKPVKEYYVLDNGVFSASQEEPSSTTITEGALYDSIINIYPDVLIQDAAGSLSILINLPSDTPEKNSVKFFDIIGSICTTCKLEDDYSSIVFSLRADSSFVTTMPLTNYTSPSSFSCAEPIVFIDEYKEPIAQIYSEVFSQNDIGNSFDKSLESLKDKYGLND